VPRWHGRSRSGEASEILAADRSKIVANNRASTAPISLLTTFCGKMITSGNTNLRDLLSRSTGDLRLRAGDWVEVRSKDEILATLDKSGQLDGLPFMPEMLAFCGRRFRVFKRAHKTCDTVNDYKARSMKDAVHLEGLRCTGLSHGGCQAGCLIFWKTAWLKEVSGNTSSANCNVERCSKVPESHQDVALAHCTETDLLTSSRSSASGEEPTYVCQATQVPAATSPLSHWKLSQYVEDYTSGNVDLTRMASGFVFMGYHHWLVNLGIGWGFILKWLYDMFQRLFGGFPYPRRLGKIPIGEPTPTASLDLQPGEWVRVKSYREILGTCDASGKNRGMTFDPEMVPYLNGTYRVLKRVTKIINERTGRMQEMKTPCIILEGVVCQSRYSDCRLFCPRSIYPYWREIWLERISENAPASASRSAESPSC
jgi:hypothetical protein